LPAGSLVPPLARCSAGGGDTCVCVLDADEGADVLTEAGNLHFRAERHAGARSCYERALAKDPGFLTAVLNIGLIHMLNDDFEDAEAHIREAIKRSPKYAYAHQSLGNLHASTRPPDGARAIAAYQRAYELEPTLAGVVPSLLDSTVRHTDILMQRGLASEAEHTLRRGMQASMPAEVSSAAAEKLINLVRDRGRPAEALDIARAALASRPTDVRVRLSQAITYRTMGNLDKALATLGDAVRLNPQDPEVTANYGLALSHSGRNTEAIHIYEQAVELRPDFVEAYVTLGDACANIFDYRCAIRNYRAALKLRPGHVPAITSLVVKRAYICDWGHYVDGDYARLELLSAEQVDGRSPVDRPAMTPFHALTLPFQPLYILQLAKAYARNALRSAEMNQIPTFTHHSITADKRKTSQGKPVLKVGYLSCDFGDHPVGRLFSPVPQFHTDEVEVTLYALNPSDNSAWRRHVERTADRFVDLSTTGMRAAAEQIHADGIHILVDLMGYTGGAFAVNRDAIMAARPAPLAISMLGYPSTVGSDFVDYVVTDRIITPPEVKAHFVEKFMYVPYSYQVNSQSIEDNVVGKDAETKKANNVPIRADYGLPPQDSGALVLSCFNSLYKIDPPVLTVWVNVLRRVPGSVLWLLNMPDQAKHQILAEAGARGLANHRLVFSDPVPHPEHLARAGLADIFLDTLNYNAHTTATDALWTGVPLVTMAASDKMQSRVAAGLTTAAGFPESVMHSLHQYEDEVVDLARQSLEVLEGKTEQLQRKRLESTRRRMLNVRHESPYFNSADWVRCFEVGLRKAWRYRRRQATKPELGALPHIVIDPDSCITPTAASRDLFTPDLVKPLRNRRRWEQNNQNEVAEVTPSENVPQIDTTADPLPPLVPSPQHKKRDKVTGPMKPAGRRCSSADECSSARCHERCCNTDGGASRGCIACDLLGDCADCDSEHVLFADACRPRGPSPWVAMQEEGAADESLEPRSVGARVPAALRQQQRTQTVASEVATATALPGTAPKARRSVAVDHEEGEEDLSSAREQLRHLVGQLREAVAEDPVSMEARLREQHGFVFT
jgi:protein O-GlcNAc transferase